MREKLAELLPSVYRFAFRLCGDQHLSEDLAQEAVVRALGAWTRLSDERAAKVWLFRIARNLWVDHCRRLKHAPVAIPDANDNVDLDQPEPGDYVATNELLALAMQTMNRLPERQKTVLHLVACEQLSIAEVAEILRITPQAVKASLSLARSQMRNLLKKVDK